MLSSLTASSRAAIAVALTLVLVAATLLGLGFTTGLPFFDNPVPGRPAAILEEIPGAETGEQCPLDARYVDENPKGLRHDVLTAWKRLRAEAQAQGVRLCLHDGKRSIAQQEREFEDAVRRFGNAELASRYVLPPEKSMHVKGIAVDVQPLASAAWVEANGARLGWCRRYENEKWHFEYDREYTTAGCPPMLPSATGS